MNRIAKLQELGQSLWYDNIERRMLENGEMAAMIERGDISGVTSNPSIFHNAISKSTDYDSALKTMAWAGWSAQQIFTQLSVEDIRAAADLFLPLYEKTNGGDGFVSLEVAPTLADDTTGTIAEAHRLWNLVNRPNLMIKIPATKAGIPAIRKCIADGLNINTTLIFSLDRYEEVIDAYMSGLEDRLAARKPVTGIAAVASFFVSRVDTKVDKMLLNLPAAAEGSTIDPKSLLGKAAIANARLAYARYLTQFTSPRFEKLREAGAAAQRPLWASTSTKNPNYRDVMYVEELIGPDTVNTVPPQTLTAFAKHGSAVVKLGWDVAEDQAVMDQLAEAGIDMDVVTRELEEEGVGSFAKAFRDLLSTIEERRTAALAEIGPFAPLLPARIVQMDYDRVVERIFAIDDSLWSNNPKDQAEIRNRLGWLVSPTTSQVLLPSIRHLAADCLNAGYDHALLLGMGGSSLAPEVLRLTFGVGEVDQKPALDLMVLDSTDPAQVAAAAKNSPLEKTLFIVSSKSGTTSEVMAFLDYFWRQAESKLGVKAGEHFIAITDPGTKLESIARERGFRGVFHGDPMVGGRYSALTSFGLVPAGLIGMDLDLLLKKANWMLAQCQPGMPSGRNPGLVLGTLLGDAAKLKRDKLTIIADTGYESFGSWLEQLVAESTGKQGRGIVPVDLEPEAPVDGYAFDRLFIYLKSSGEHEPFAENLRAAGHPVLTFSLNSPYDLGAEFYRWEFAVAVASSVLEVNGFDQPDVQDSKTRTEKKINAFREKGSLDEPKTIWEGETGRAFGVKVKAYESANTLREVVKTFIESSKDGDYIAINAYLPRDDRTMKRLQKLRKSILLSTGRATTLGFGPRFQHSTGQLHKGGPASGLFLQITTDAEKDLEIPNQGITFATLERAQALGDLEALTNRKRRVLRVHLNKASDVTDLI